MLQHYMYPFKVWITSALLGSIGFIAYTAIHSSSGESTGVDAFFLLVLLFSLLYSIPSAILLWLTYHVAIARLTNLMLVKSIMTLSAQVFFISTLFIMFNRDFKLLEYLNVILPFSVALLISTLVLNVNPQGKHK